VHVESDERRADDQSLDALSGGLDRSEVEQVQHAGPQGDAAGAGAGDDEPNRYPPKAVPQTKIGQTIIRSIPPGPSPRSAFAMNNPSATSERTQDDGEISERGSDDPRREDRGEPDEDERPEGDEFVDDTEGFGEHGDGDGARAAERNDDRQGPVAQRAPEEPSRRQD